MACLVVGTLGCGSATDRHVRDLETGTLEEQRAAARALGELGPDAAHALPALRAALTSVDGEVRRSAAYALGRIGPAAADAGADLEGLLAHEDPKTRLNAAYALREVAPENTAPLDVLTDAAKQGNPRAIVALGTMGDAAAPARPVLERLRASPNDIVRSMAAEALEKIANAER